MMSKRVPPGWFIPFFLIELFSLQREFLLIDLTLLFLVKSWNHIFIHSVVDDIFFPFPSQLGYGFKICSCSLKDIHREWGLLDFPIRKNKQFNSSGNPTSLDDPSTMAVYYYPTFLYHQDILRELGADKRCNEMLVTWANREYFI